MTATPYFITVAPNGARRTLSDHQAVPVTVEDTARCAKACMEAGAAMIHLHVRDCAGQSLQHPVRSGEICRGQWNAR